MADLSPHILLPWTILIYVCIENFFSAINLEKESLYLVETFPLPEPDLVYPTDAEQRYSFVVDLD